jgi:hypothetical protein
MFFKAEMNFHLSFRLSFKETISKKLGDIKKPVSAENLYRPKFKSGYNLEEKK